MPIGLLIGWLIGQLIFALTCIAANNKTPRHAGEQSKIAIQTAKAAGLFLFWTAIFGLIGTFIELIVR